MDKLTVWVYRDSLGDCTGRGVSSRHNTMTLFSNCTKKEALQHCIDNCIDVDSALYLNMRELWGEDHPFAEPLIKPSNKVGPMFGGNFVYTSDSRLYRFGGKYHLPIPVHDRFETQEEYDALSR